MRTLLTGFGPFGAIIDNPSARIVAHFAEAGALGHALTTRVLPVSYDRAAEEVSALLREGAFDAALLMGVATRTAVLRLERVARLRGGGHRPDVDGRSPADTTLSLGALPTYTATVALEPLAAVLAAADVPARLSDDAGGYVCNHTYYAALQTLAATGLPTRCHTREWTRAAVGAAVHGSRAGAGRSAARESAVSALLSGHRAKTEWSGGSAGWPVHRALSIAIEAVSMLMRGDGRMGGVVGTHG
jgi:pyroglutamyl-peptidase